MNPIYKFSKKAVRGCRSLLATFATITLLAQGALAAPAENSVQSLVRTSASGLVLQATLTKNINRQEAYQAEYIEKVPYQAQEAYTDYESYTDYERQCHNEYDNQCRNSYERQCRTSYERVCHNEQRCHQVSQPQCRNEVVCHQGSSNQNCQNVQECGTNALGQQICKTRQVCNGTPGGQVCENVQRCDNGYRNECNTEYVCNNEPRQVCENVPRQICENVPHQVCQNVAVTKQRAVTKYRTVTKYKNETRCCKTAYRDVFDHQQSMDVVVQFPQGSELSGSKKEKFQVSLLGTEASPDVALKVISQTHRYQVVNKEINGNQAVITLDVVGGGVVNPPDNGGPVDGQDPALGPNSIKDLKMKIMGDKSVVVVFSDNGVRSDIDTSYELIVTDINGNVETQKEVASNGRASVTVTMDDKLSYRETHTLELRVTRSGAGLVEPISFSRTFLRQR